MAMVESGVILVGEGLGESGFESIKFISGWVAVFTFLVLPCFARDSTYCLNWVSTDTLFIAASSSMLEAVASSSSSSSNSYDKMSLRFPFPFSRVPFFFLEVDISLAIFVKFSFVMA